MNANTNKMMFIVMVFLLVLLVASIFYIHEEQQKQYKILTEQQDKFWLDLQNVCLRQDNLQEKWNEFYTHWEQQYEPFVRILK